MKTFHSDIKRAIDNERISLPQAMAMARRKWDVEVKLRGHDNTCWPKMLWQVMFDVYRAFGGPLDEMHDMLCDFDNIKRLLEAAGVDSTIEFYWYFEPGYRFTVFDIREHYGEEFGLHFKFTEDTAVTVRHLFSVYESTGDPANHAGD